MYLLTICMSSLEKMSIQICCSLFNWIVLVFSIELHEFLCILDVNSLSDVMICKYFLSFGRLSFHSVVQNVPLLCLLSSHLFPSVFIAFGVK